MMAKPSSMEISQLGKYQIKRELGRGSMGVVYEGFDPIIQRRVALKTIRKDLLSSAEQLSGILARFKREAQAAGRLTHPNIVAVYDYGEDSNTAYIAMEYADGKTLKDYFAKRHRFDIDTAVDIFSQLLDALAFSHKHGVIHRDIKPANVILMPDGQIKVADFGIARIDTSDLTLADQTLGTPSYMSPEQILGQPVDGRCDIFSAAVIFYQFLTGQKPFQGDMVTVMQNILNANPPHPSGINSELPGVFDGVIAKALNKQPHDRYHTASEFKQAVLAAQRSAPTTGSHETLRGELITVDASSRNQAIAFLPRTIDEWTEWLSEKEMPIFSHTAKSINQTIENDRAGAMELSRIILNDPGLTAKLLKLSNSSFYNPSGQSMGTIMRAIVVLGSKLIRELTIACTFIESVIPQHNKHLVNTQLAKAIHAAVQAKYFSILTNDASPEEIFVSALLRTIGQIAFWCFDQHHHQKILAAIERGDSREQAEQKVLGFTLDALGESLSNTWCLGDFIKAVIQNDDDSDQRIQLIQLSHELAEITQESWDSEKLMPCLEKISALTHRSPEALEQMVRKNAESAVKIAMQFGAGDASVLIPSPNKSQLEDTKEQPSPALQSVTLDNNKKLQMQILQEITSMLSSKIDLNVLFEMVMEGIHRAIGMDRTLFALMTPDRKTLIEKSSLGWSREKQQGKFRFPIINDPRNLFSFILAQSSAQWIRPENDRFVASLYDPNIQEHIGRHESFVTAVNVNQKPIGIFYCDRSISKRSLNPEAFHAFKLFVQQADLGLAFSQQRKS